MGFIFIRDSWRDRKIASYKKQLEKEYKSKHYEDPQYVSGLVPLCYIIVKPAQPLNQ